LLKTALECHLDFTPSRVATAFNLMTEHTGLKG